MIGMHKIGAIIIGNFQSIIDSGLLGTQNLTVARVINWHIAVSQGGATCTHTIASGYANFIATYELSCLSLLHIAY